MTRPLPPRCRWPQRLCFGLLSALIPTLFSWGASNTNTPGPASPRAAVAAPAVEWRLPSLVSDSLVLRRRRPEYRNDQTTFTLHTLGMGSLRADTVKVRGGSGPSVTVKALGDTRTDPVGWEVVFEDLEPQEPFHLEFRGRVRNPLPRSPRTSSLILSNLTVGEVWLWEPGSGQTVPLLEAQREDLLRTLKAEDVVVRMIDARPGSPRASADSRREVGSTLGRRWETIAPEELAASGRFPNFLPAFVTGLAKAVRTEWDGRPGETGRPLAIGLILVDPATVPPGSRVVDVRGGHGTRVARESVNPSVRAAMQARPGVSDAEMTELKRAGKYPPPLPRPDLLDGEVVAGPFVGFPYPDVSGMIRCMPATR